MLKYFLWEYTIFAAKNHIYRIFYGTKILAKNSASQKPSFPGMAEAQGSLTEHVLSFMTLSLNTQEENRSTLGHSPHTVQAGASACSPHFLQCGPWGLLVIVFSCDSG